MLVAEICHLKVVTSRLSSAVDLVSVVTPVYLHAQQTIGKLVAMFTAKSGLLIAVTTLLEKFLA
jgi:uncharacterized membrane protein